MLKTLKFSIDGKSISKTVEYTVLKPSIEEGFAKIMASVHGMNAVRILKDAVEASLISCTYVQEKLELEKAQAGLLQLMQECEELD